MADSRPDSKSGDWKRMQEKTFTKWFNNVLSLNGHADAMITSLRDDLKDGLRLALLLETLTGQRIKNIDPQPKSKPQKIINLERIFAHLQKQKIKLVNIGESSFN